MEQCPPHLFLLCANASEICPRVNSVMRVKESRLLSFFFSKRLSNIEISFTISHCLFFFPFLHVPNKVRSDTITDLLKPPAEFSVRTLKCKQSMFKMHCHCGQN